VSKHFDVSLMAEKRLLPRPAPRKRVRRGFVAALALTLIAAIALDAWAQVGPSSFVVTRFWDGSAIVNAGDSGNNALRTVLVTALPAGTSNIGDVDVLTLPALPAGGNTIGNVGLVAGSAAIGTVGLTSASSANNAGAQVSVTTSSGTVLASFATRKAANICASPTNTDVVHLKLGATATTSNGKLWAGQCFSMGTGPVYTGVIDARSATGTQELTVWEW
jgi:hypothetical protein